MTDLGELAFCHRVLLDHDGLADPADTLRWYQMAGETFNKYGIGRAAWTYREKDFGLDDEHMAGVLKELLRYL